MRVREGSCLCVCRACVRVPARARGFSCARSIASAARRIACYVLLCRAGMFDWVVIARETAGICQEDVMIILGERRAPASSISE